MTSEGKVSFKASVKTDDDKREFRYFTIDHGAATSIDYLNAKLQNLFPILSKKKFVVNWIDHEGDEIAISSDEELIYALSTMGDLKKLSIQLSTERVIEFSIHTDNCTSSSPVHPGVICDICENEIYGFRYKCMICPDFDLCETCESHKHHDKHVMVRLPIFVRSLRTETRGSKFGDWLERFAKKAKEVENNSTENKSHHHGKESHHCKRLSKRKRKYMAHANDMMHVMSNCFEDFLNLAGDVKLKHPSSTEQNEGRRPEPCLIPNPGASAGGCPAFPLGNKHYEQFTKPFIDSINNALARIDPLGYSRMQTEPGPTPAQNAAEEPQPSAQPPTPRPANEPMEETAEKQSIEKPTSSVPNFDLSSDSEDSDDCIILKSTEDNPNVYDWTILNSEEPGDNERIEPVNAAKPNEAQNATIDNLIQSFQSNVSTQDSLTQTSPEEQQPILTPNVSVPDLNAPNFGHAIPMQTSNFFNQQPMIAPPGFNPIMQIPSNSNIQPNPQLIPGPVNNWFQNKPIWDPFANPMMPNPIPNFVPQVPVPPPIINQPVIAPMTTAIPLPPPPAVVNPPAPEIRTPPRPTKPHIAATFDRLIAMGFTNDNGVLTYLAEAHDGNINEVLDVLSRMQGKN